MLMLMNQGVPTSDEAFSEQGSSNDEVYSSSEKTESKTVELIFIIITGIKIVKVIKNRKKKGRKHKTI